MMNKDEQFIAIAEDYAKQVPKAFGARIGAIIVHKGRIVARGNNKNKTHPFQKRFSKHEESIYLHAENDAIIKSPRNIDLSKCTMYIARVKENINKTQFYWGNAKPCNGCQKSVAMLGNVVYTMENGIGYL